MNKADELLRELVESIERRWAQESERKRSNAISPRTEEALHNAKVYLGIPSQFTPID